jgi:signal transduction histidine kinase
MKSQPTIQPGVLESFRLFTGVRLVLLILAILAQVFVGTSVRPRLHISNLLLISVLDAGLLFLFLSAGRLLRLMGRAYLPVGIIWAALGPMIETHMVYFMLSNRQEGPLILGAWQMVPVLFIPLVIISWQYSFREVLLFCAATILGDVLPFILFPLATGAQASFAPLSFVGVVLIRAVTFMLVGNMIVGMMKIQRAQRGALADANTRLARYASTLEQLTISRERNRMARELHDVLAHTLSGVAVELEAVRALWEVDPGRAQAMLAHSLESTRSGLTETRRALQELRATPLEDLGMILAVRGLAEAVTSRAGLRLDLNIPDSLGDYPPEVEQTVYRVTQEALSNAAQHAGAGCIRLSLGEEDGWLKLVVADDGQGFDPRALTSEQQFGIRGMRERVEMLGGQFEVASLAGQGTTVLLRLAGAQARVEP